MLKCRSTSPNPINGSSYLLSLITSPAAHFLITSERAADEQPSLKRATNLCSFAAMRQEWLGSGCVTCALTKHLLLLIQIENSAEEFALYVVHTSGGKSEGHGVL